VSLPLRSSRPTKINQVFSYKHELRLRLASLGANEVLTYSFVHGDLLKKCGTDPARWAHHLRNAISPDLQYYRTSLIPSLLAKVHPNIKAQAGSENNRFALFEIGKAHVKGHEDKDMLPIQHERIALIIAADDKSAEANYKGAPFYAAKSYVSAITGSQAEFTELDTDEFPISSPYQKNRSALITINGTLAGVIGEFKPAVRSALKLPVFCAGFEMDVGLMQKSIKPARYEPIAEYPGSSQDLTLEVAATLSWGKAQTTLQKALEVLEKDNGFNIAIEPKDIYMPEEGDKKRLTFQIQVFHPSKTLKTEEVTRVTDQLAKAAETINAIKV
jgi:phenylalanyl-tRNA synthetase beta subunit